MRKNSYWPPIIITLVILGYYLSLVSAICLLVEASSFRIILILTICAISYFPIHALSERMKEIKEEDDDLSQY